MMERRHCLVIGGTRGIGRAFVRLLAAREDHTLSVIGRRPPSEPDERLPGVRSWAVDVLDEGQLTTVLGEVIRQHGKLHELVCFQKYRGDGEAWAGELATSLTATKWLIERLAEEFDPMADDRAIVLVSSIASCFVAEEQPASYHVAKAGLIQMARYYAATLGPRRIRVNAVSPGTILKAESREFYLANEPLLELYRRITPLDRMGTAEEVAQVIAFLCSPKASWMTGQNLVVDGGVSLQAHESLARKLADFSQLRVTRQPSESPR